MKNTEILNELKLASEGLMYSSESEYAFQVLCWEGTSSANPETVIQKTNHDPEVPVKVVGIDDFFLRATTEQDWYGDEEKAITAKYKALVETLKGKLNNLKVYRLGEIEIDVYIVGEAPTGDLIGLSTKVIET